MKDATALKIDVLGEGSSERRLIRPKVGPKRSQKS
jgi:hypothetical protein